MNDQERAVMQQALEALEFASLDSFMLEPISPGRESTVKAITALRAALAQPASEPVAKVELMMTGGNAGLATRIVEIDDHLRERLHPGQLLYTAPDPLTIERLRDALVASRIVPPAAVEDSDEYDDGVTLHRIEALHRRIT